jgi:hypothetical protein
MIDQNTLAPPAGVFPYLRSDYADTWPFVADEFREFETIQCARHLDIGEDHPNFRILLNNTWGFVC